jgi:hypothetical protein
MRPIYSFKKINKNIELCKPFEFEESHETILGIQFYKIGIAISCISECLVKNELLGRNKILKVAIVLPKDSIGKHKEEDSETTLESLIALTESFASLECGIHYTFFKTEKTFHIENKNGIEFFWKLDELWEGKGNYILINSDKKVWVKNNLEYLEELCKKEGYDIQHLNYSLRLKDRINLLKNCKAFISPSSSHLRLSLLMNVPTIFYEDEHLRGILLEKNYLNDLCGLTSVGMVHFTKFKRKNYIEETLVDNVVSLCNRADNSNFLENYFLEPNKSKFKFEYAKKNKNLLIVNNNITEKIDFVRKNKKCQKNV